MPMTDSRLVTAARLQLTRPGPLLWAFGMALSLLTTLLSGPGSRDEFAVASYLLGLLLFAGVLGGEPSRSLRRWLSPARWSPGRLLAVAFGARAAALVGGFLLAAALLATAGSAAPVALVARTVAVLLAGAAWVTLFSSFCRGWLDLVAVLLLQGMAGWWAATLAATPGPGLALVLAACLPPLAAGLEGGALRVAWPLAVTAGALLLSWWLLRRTEVPA
jgi:hypothetical protein